MQCPTTPIAHMASGTFNCQRSRQRTMEEAAGGSTGLAAQTKQTQSLLLWFALASGGGRNHGHSIPLFLQTMDTYV